MLRWGIPVGTVIRSLFCMQRADILQKEMMDMRFRSFVLRIVLKKFKKRLKKIQKTVDKSFAMR